MKIFVDLGHEQVLVFNFTEAVAEALNQGNAFVIDRGEQGPALRERVSLKAQLVEDRVVAAMIARGQQAQADEPKANGATTEAKPPNRKARRASKAKAKGPRKLGGAP